MPAETHVTHGPIDRQEIVDLVRDRLADILEVEPSTIHEGDSFADDLEHNARWYGKTPAYTQDGRQITHAGLLARAKQLGAALYAAGARRRQAHRHDREESRQQLL